MDSVIASDSKDTDALLRLVLRTIRDGVIAFDGSGVIQSVNDAAATIFHCAPDDLVGRDLATRLPQVRPEPGQDLPTFLAAHDFGCVRKVSARRSDELEFPVELVVNELRPQSGHFIATLRDLSFNRAEWRPADGAAPDAFYGVLMEGVTDYAILFLDPDGRITMWNAGAQRLKGYRAEEIIGRHFSAFYTSDDQARGVPDQTLTRARSEGKVEEESLRVRKDGSHFWASQVVVPVWGERDAVLGYIKVTRDITERKEAERRVADEAARLQAVTNTVLDGLITIDDHGLIQTFNPAATRIFGYTETEVVGHNVNMLMPDPYRAEHDGYLGHYLSGGAARVIGIGREVSGRRKNGTVFPMELGVNEMQANGARSFVGTVRDISERKAADAAIHDFIDKLTRSNQELDDFAYIASHDLKEPIRGLSNNARFLHEDYTDAVDDTGKRRLNRMVYLCQRMEALVDDLLYFSRLSRQELAIQSVDLNAVIRDIELMMEATLVERNVEIVLPAPLPVVTCDVPRVTELFRNLIGNAVKYNDKPRKRVEIGVSEIDEARQAPVFYVRDNGIGIDARFFSDIFRIFKRLNEEDDTVKGTGVGLTFVKKIVERHSGRIWLESELGVGTTFYFTLPAPEGT